MPIQQLIIPPGAKIKVGCAAKPSSLADVEKIACALRDIATPAIPEACISFIQVNESKPQQVLILGITRDFSDMIMSKVTAGIADCWLESDYIDILPVHLDDPFINVIRKHSIPSHVIN